MALKRTKLQERYELRAVLGRGGMGVVYKALDTLMKREVALKTILDIDNPALVELFYKEWSIVATMVHPNVIGIYDIGEFEEEGIKKPFFVMPLLPGVALDKLIRDGSPRLTVENVVNIIDQACRGLHAAHEQGLVHRDVKPSNIFVMDDDSVKIIDFGIARIASTQSKTGIKGTLFYLAPELLEMKPPTALSDQFALAVAAYEALTRRRPFDGASDDEVFEAIRKLSPPPVSELNPNVNYAISQVIHKAMAKQPYHRFLTIREFGDALQKARRNEPLETVRQRQDQAAAGEGPAKLRAGRLRFRPAKSCRSWKRKAASTRRSHCCGGKWTRRCGTRASSNRWKARGAFSRPRSTRWRCARSRKRWTSTRKTPTPSRSRPGRTGAPREKKIEEWIQMRTSTSTTRHSARRATR